MWYNIFVVNWLSVALLLLLPPFHFLYCVAWFFGSRRECLLASPFSESCTSLVHTHTHCFFCVCWGELWHLLCNRTSIFWPFFYDNASDTPVCEREIKVALVASPNSPNHSTIYMLFFFYYMGEAGVMIELGKTVGYQLPFLPPQPTWERIDR